MALGGAGFVINNFAIILAPAYASSGLLLPMIIAALSLTLWFLVSGVDVTKWEAKPASSEVNL